MTKLKVRRTATVQTTQVRGSVSNVPQGNAQTPAVRFGRCLLCGASAITEVAVGPVFTRVCDKCLGVGAKVFEIAAWWKGKYGHR